MAEAADVVVSCKLIPFALERGDFGAQGVGVRTVVVSQSIVMRARHGGCEHDYVGARAKLRQGDGLTLIAVDDADVERIV
jgi:hypothetical protein